MPKIKPTAGPMRTQPIERASTIPTLVLPMMPTAGKADKTAQPMRRPTRAESPRRQGENNPAKLLAETAGRPEGLVSRIYFPIQTLPK